MKEFLRTVSLFSQLTDEEIELLARTAKERFVPEGSHIVSKGDPGHSAFVLKEGAAEARLEKPPGVPLQLSKIGPGDLFGELALFDDEPRSASVVAIQDTTLIEISRDMFLREVAQHPKLALRLLALVVKRLRRAESIVSDFSERIYGDVMPRLEAAVSAQLNSAKEICEQSKERSESTKAQAEHVLKFGKWVVSIVSTLVVVAVTLAGFLGIDKLKGYDESIQDYIETISEIERTVEEKKRDLESTIEKSKVQAKDTLDGIVSETNEVVEEIKLDRKYIGVLRETTLVFDKLRRDLQLENATEGSRSDSSPGNVARDFLVAHRQLKKDYLDDPTKWEPEILMEALDLVAEMNDRHYVQLDQDDWGQVINTIVYAVEFPPDHWRERQRLGDLIQKLSDQMSHMRSTAPTGTMAEDLKKRMERLLPLATEEEASVMIALNLARMGSKEKLVRKELKKWQTTEESPWGRTQAGIALVKIGEEQGWEILRKDLVAGWIGSDSGDEKQGRREQAAFSVAILLAADVVDAKTDWSRRARIGLKELNRQLSAEKLTFSAKALTPSAEPWPENAPVGADLIGESILKQGTKNPKAWSKFFWDYACTLLCRLDCETPDKAAEKKLCTRCFEQLPEEYSLPGKELDRPTDICAAGDKGTGSSN